MTTRRGFIGMLASIAAAIGLPIKRSEATEYDPIADFQRVRKMQKQSIGIVASGEFQGTVVRSVFTNEGWKWKTHPISHVSRIDRSMPAFRISTLSIYGITENGTEKCVFSGIPSECPPDLIEKCRRSGFNLF